MEELVRQHDEIDRINRRYQGQFTLLKGIEANIRADGTVDMSADELRLLQIVVAAPHSALRSPHDQTARMTAAVSTPGVNILGHPRGRMYRFAARRRRRLAPRLRRRPAERGGD